MLSGEYAITETQPAGYFDGIDVAGTSGGVATNPGDSVDTIVLAEGTDATGYTFGEVLEGSISGSVIDTNGDPIADVEIVLSGTDDLGDPVLLTTTTGPDGTYSLVGLRPGTYAVTETQPAGYGEAGQVSDDPDADTLVTNVISNLVLESGESSAGNDFTERFSTISGVVFHDLDNDGVQGSDEVGIAGVELSLTGTDANGAPVTQTVVTDIDGAYTFVDLLSGEYAITETQPAAYSDGIDVAGTSGGIAAVGGDEISAIPLAAGTDAESYTFAEIGTPIIGTVWIDDDRDGVIDVGEPGISGVTITLLDSNGDVVGVTVTDDTGSYSFADLPAGDYSIVQTQPSGFGSTTPSTIAVTLTVVGITDADFGEDLGSIGDTVWADTDGDGVQGGNELGVSGVVVNLLDADGNTIETTTTDADGIYLFDRLPVGTYLIEIEPPADLALTAQGQGDPAIDSDPDRLTGLTDPITLAVLDCGGADCLLDRRTDIDAGLIEPVIDLAISGEVSTRTPRVGDIVTFSYETVNNSNIPVVSGAEVTVQFPVGLLPDGVVAPGWEVSVDGQTVTLVLDRVLLPGEELPAFSITAQVVSSAGTFFVDAKIGTRDGSSETTLVNNEAQLSIVVMDESLPETGSTPAGLIRAALLLLLAGALLALLGRRRLAS